MTAPASFIPSATMRDALKNGIALNIGGSSPDALYIALYNSSYPQTVDTDPLSYSATDEVTGTNWSAGGTLLVSPAMTLTAGVGITFAVNAVSVATTTLASVVGGLIYDNTLSPKCGIAWINFSGSYSTTAGTFAVNWATANSVSNTVWYITL